MSVPIYTPRPDKHEPTYRFSYYRLHVPSGKITTATQAFNSRSEFDRKVNDWNRSNPGVWQYWSE